MRRLRLLKHDQVELAVAPPLPLLVTMAELIGRQKHLALAAQNVAWQVSGALTGEVSPALLAEIGCRYALIGHSERKQYFGETIDQSAKRLAATLAAGLVPVVCIGEDWPQRSSGQAEAVLKQQLKTLLAALPKTLKQPLVICYEPFWTISTSGGRIATSIEVSESVAVIWQALKKALPAAALAHCRVLYGGTVSPDSIQNFTTIAGLSGFLVGGAALEVATFKPIINHLNSRKPVV